ncbi:MAG: GNAT family N-acetyltransferase [Rhodoglobus sp.]
MSEFLVRAARTDDASGVARVHVDGWRAAYRGLLPDSVLDGLRVEDRAVRWSRWIAASDVGTRNDPGVSEGHRMLVAEVDGHVVGWATLGPGRDEGMADHGELAGLYVHPDHWSLGIGFALITQVETELRASGITEAYVWVLRGNDRAIRFYEQCGWRSDGGTKVGSAGGVDDLQEERHWRNLKS